MAIGGKLKWLPAKLMPEQRTLYMDIIRQDKF